MELPESIKNLYRHWPLHTSAASHGYPSYIPGEMVRFIEERILIWKRRTIDGPAPYSDDLILSTYRFCNILRELDRQTIAIHTALNPFRKDFPLWLMNMFYSRLVARPETVAVAGLLSFKPAHNERVYERLLEVPRPRYGTPYVFPVSTMLTSATPTRELFLTRHLPTVMPRIAERIASWQKMPVYDAVAELLPLFGFNHAFLWTEVLIDAAYQYPDRLDLFARFPIGPGSLPTFAALAPEEDPSLLVARLAATETTIDMTYGGKPIRLSAENWEGIGCEYRKYTNLQKGAGRKRLYRKSE